MKGILKRHEMHVGL